jgi:hypothetical protein
MKKTVYFIIIILMTIIHIDIYSQNKRDNSKVKSDTVSVDSLEHKLIINDHGFETWLITQPPMNFYSKSYYEQRNRLYVSEWNQRYMSNRGRGRYETYIDYDYSIDYGLEMNYKLYNYFRYFEISNGVRLISSGRR